jgi:hypothetical protein
MIALLRALIWPLTALFAWLTGRRQAKAETALQAAEAYAKKRKDMDDADADLSDDPAVLREWLRARDPGQR